MLRASGDLDGNVEIVMNPKRVRLGFPARREIKYLNGRGMFFF